MNPALPVRFIIRLGILTGDAEYHDNWHDIQGYAKIVADTLQREMARQEK